jgi:hypothetical protein
VRARTSAGTHLQGSGVGTDGAGALLGAVGQPLAVPLALGAGRVGNRLRGATAATPLAALQRLLAGLLGLLLDAVGLRTELLVLDA